MKTKKKIIFYALTIVLLNNACAPAYIPNVTNTPLLSNKGEVQIGVHSGISGIDPQLAYAITDHIGIMLNGSYKNRRPYDTSYFHNHQFIELGIGYYTKISENTIFETFGGYGYGKLETQSDDILWNTNLKANYSRIFIQPALGVTSDFFDGSIASRFVMLNMHQTLNISKIAISGTNADTISSTGSKLFFEPVLTGKIGYKDVKAVFQLGLTLPFNPKNNDIVYQPYLISLGLQGNLFKRHKNTTLR